MKYNLDALERAARNGGLSEKTIAKLAAYQKFLEAQRDRSAMRVEQCKNILNTK